MDDRKKLPDIYEKRYKSENLKRAIADEGMWYLIPCVSGSMDSPQGIHRIKENDLLFTFIDQYFPDAPFAFEPYMVDGRFVFLPDNVEHQGMGVSVSKDLPGYLEISQMHDREIVIKSINTERKKDKWELHLSRTRKPWRR